MLPRLAQPLSKEQSRSGLLASLVFVACGVLMTLFVYFDNAHFDQGAHPAPATVTYSSAGLRSGRLEVQLDDAQQSPRAAEMTTYFFVPPVGSKLTVSVNPSYADGRVRLPGWHGEQFMLWIGGGSILFGLVGLAAVVIRHRQGDVA